VFSLKPLGVTKDQAVAEKTRGLTLRRGALKMIVTNENGVRNTGRESLTPGGPLEGMVRHVGSSCVKSPTTKSPDGLQDPKLG